MSPYKSGSIWKQETNPAEIQVGDRVIEEACTQKKFSEFIKERREAAGNISTKELADRLGIGYEYFRKIINKQKTIKNRDLIIAICVALGLSSEETNEALTYYNFMPSLDKESDGRDKAIAEALDSSAQKPIPLDDFNRFLKSKGFSGLKTISHHSGAIKSVREALPFEVIEGSKRVKSFTDCWIENPFDSLDTLYHPERYRVMAQMLLKDCSSGKVYKLYADGKGVFSKSLAGDLLEDRYHQLDETGLFKPYFTDLDNLARTELKRLYAILNDTKNYQERASANIVDNSLHVFVETYNFTVPELGEYLLFEYIGGKQRLSINSSSKFMCNYLSPEDYAKYYGGKSSNTKENTSCQVYDSVEMFESGISNTSHRAISWPGEIIKKEEVRIFQRMKETANNLIEDLKSGRATIGPKDILEDGDQVCKFYGVEKEFDCEYIGEVYSELRAQKNSVCFPVHDRNKTIEITLADLYRASELGLNSIQEIINIKEKFGSLDGIFNDFQVPT